MAYSVPAPSNEDTGGEDAAEARHDRGVPARATALGFVASVSIDDVWSVMRMRAAR
jgi:hypothetical protein